jgi:hypothetical protein
MSNKRINTFQVWPAQDGTVKTIAQAGTFDIELDLNTYQPEGFLGMEFEVTGAGQVNIVATVASDDLPNADFTTPAAWTTEGNLVTGFATGSVGYVDISKALGTFYRSIKLTVTEDGTGTVTDFKFKWVIQ